MIPHHLVTGPEDAPVLVLSNSLGSTLAMWDGVADALAERFRLVRYDTRGHGGSDVPPGPYTIDELGSDLIELLDQLGIERAHVAGLSLGGMTAMWLAINAPERVDRLVLLCTSAQLGPPENWAERAALVREQGTQAVVVGTMQRWLTDGFREANSRVVLDLEEMVGGIDPEGYAAACAVIERMDLSGQLGSIRAPTLAIAGAQDPATPPEHLRQIVAGVRDGRLEILDPAAHMAAVERPEEIAALILEHLEPSQSDNRYEAGLKVRREVLGDDHVDRALAGATAFSRPFQDYITRAAWGEAWTRDGLDRRTRSSITLAVLTALRAEAEIPMHVRAAIRNGLTPDEIREVLIHTAVYAGVPAANRAIALAQKTLEELGEI